MFLCGLQDGTLPITYAETPAEIEEERRLLYVGMTRARRDLALSWAWPASPAAAPPASRPGSSPRCCPREARPPPKAARAKGARMCAECGRPLQTAADKARRRCADCPAPYDEELFERLREWRTERARDEEIAAFMVFSNATLEEIADPPTAVLARAAHGQRGGPGEARRSTARSCSSWSGEPAGTPLDLAGSQLGRKSREIPIKSFAHYRAGTVPCWSQAISASRD